MTIEGIKMSARHGDAWGQVVLAAIQHLNLQQAHQFGNDGTRYIICSITEEALSQSKIAEDSVKREYGGLINFPHKLKIMLGDANKIIRVEWIEETKTITYSGES